METTEDRKKRLKVAFELILNHSVDDEIMKFRLTCRTNTVDAGEIGAIKGSLKHRCSERR